MGSCQHLPHLLTPPAQNWEGALSFGVTPYIQVSYALYPMQRKFRTSPRWGSAPIQKNPHHSGDTSTYSWHDLKIGCPKPYLPPQAPKLQSPLGPILYVLSSSDYISWIHTPSTFMAQLYNTCEQPESWEWWSCCHLTRARSNTPTPAQFPLWGGWRASWEM